MDEVNERILDAERARKSFNEISANKVHKDSDKFTCVYFLWDGEEIVYIGQTSRHPGYRARHHDTKFKFDSYSYILVKNEVKRIVEWYFIQRFSPKYNRITPEPVPSSDVLRQYGLTREGKPCS